MFSCGAAAAAIFGYWSLYRSFYRSLDPVKQTPLAKPLIVYAFPIFIITISAQFSFELNTFLLGLIGDSAQVGIYEPAKLISVRLPHIAMILVMGVLPIFADLHPDRLPEQRRLLRKLSLLMLGVYGAICFDLIGASWFMPLVFGRDFAASATPLRIMIPFNLAFGLSRFFRAFSTTVARPCGAH